MTIRTTLITSSLIAASLVSGAAQAALFDRGGGLIYDDVLNVTWLQDANYAKTSGYDADGYMNWADATTWAANLSYYDSVRNVTYTDWRLPTMVDTGSAGYDEPSYGGTDTGTNVQTVSGSTVYSEMAHMYYTNLGFNANYLTSGIFGDGTEGGQKDVGPIKNLQSSFYWSGLEFALNPDWAWYFYTGNGSQYAGGKLGEQNAWVVRSGDVAAVPEAETYALMLAGLGLIGWRARRRG